MIKILHADVKTPEFDRGFVCFSIYIQYSGLQVTNVPRGCYCLAMGWVVLGLDMRKC